MRKFKRAVCLILSCLMLPGIFMFSAQARDIVSNANSGMSVSVKYAGGGQWSKYSMQEATIGAPAVADLDGDGKAELVFSALSVFCLDGATGKIKWRTYSGKDTSTKYDKNYGPDYGRASIAPMIVDLDGDGKLDIVTAQTNYSTSVTCLAVYDAKGRFKSGWPVYTERPVVAVKASDVDGDGKKELCVGFSVGATKKDAVALYSCNGQKRWSVKNGYGLYSNAIETIDLDGDGKLEIVGLYDDDNVFAFDRNGNAVVVTGDDTGLYQGIEWNGLPVCEDFGYETKCAEWARAHGGYCCAWSDAILGTTRQEKNVMMGTRGGIVAADMDGDGTTELAGSVLIVDGSKTMRTGSNSFEGVAQYFTAFILNKNRTRYKNEQLGYDWTQIPLDPGVIISMDNKNMPQFPDCTPIVADLNGDGEKEILYSAPDGYLHCFSLDGTERDGWPYNLNPNRGKSGWVIEYATKPTAADIDGDGQLEVVFASYTQKDQKAKRGSLYIVDCHGNLLAKDTIRVMWGNDADVSYANGSVAQPTVADIDNDGALEIAITTQSAGVVAYEINRTPFKDVPAKSWYTVAVAWCYRKGLMSGTSGNTFSPNTALSRAMFVQILAKVGGVNLNSYTPSGTFTDVPKNSWYAKAVEWAYKNGITGGTTATTFGPNASVTREQMTLFLYKFAALTGGDVEVRADLSGFADVGEISTWAVESMSWAVARGLVSGTTKTTLSPKLAATRAQAAVVIVNYIFAS